MTFDPFSPEPVLPLETQHNKLRQLRQAVLAHHRPLLQEKSHAIRTMAQIIKELEQACREHQITEIVMRAEIVDRTVGDVNLRMVTECEDATNDRKDYRILADELGIALPGEQLHGRTANGETYHWLRERMVENERLLLEHHYDPRVYDVYSIGNPLLRAWLAQEMQRWGLPVSEQQTYVGLGGMDCLDKVLRGLAHIYRTQQLPVGAILFPSPSFSFPEWSARSSGYRFHNVSTRPENHFKLTGEQLEDILHNAPDIRIIYLILNNNPSTFSYTPDDLRAIHAVLQRYQDQGRNIFLLVDLAYIGTGKPEDDQARLATFCAPDAFQRSIFISSFSKTYTLTGERFGWLSCGNPQIAASLPTVWTNTYMSLPGDWQLRFMAYYQLFQDRPWLVEKLRSFYRYRRVLFLKELQRLNEQFQIFEEIYLDNDTTIYNWSKLQAGEDVFSIFEKTGIAGVPGSGFGYTDDYIRFSIGVAPCTG